ncbi:hypothetical protein [Pseudoxanthomonas sp.]|uniref:hypothetical protein n=1 Tax=Pseudoxanthomonas sp. TaxID=1871049 RepID=UPI0025EC1DF4|nr:hypothetical protein [Pseudoxanthomonas sp.]
MLRFLRHRRVALLRLPALAMLLLAVLANPVLASLGDLHELGNGNEHLHAVNEHADVATGHDHADGEAGEGDLLHALMHASHCCGHLTAIVPAPMRVPAMILRDVTPIMATVPMAHAPRASLLRPPIAA